MFQCTKCGYRGSACVINVEANIHHNRPLLCFDTKQCNLRLKKLKQK